MRTLRLHLVNDRLHHDCELHLVGNIDNDNDDNFVVHNEESDDDDDNELDSDVEIMCKTVMMVKELHQGRKQAGGKTSKQIMDV